MQMAGVLRVLEAIEFSEWERPRGLTKPLVGTYGKVQEIPQARPLRSIHVALRCRQALWVLDHHQLPGCLRALRCNGILFNHEFSAGEKHW